MHKSRFKAEYYSKYDNDEERLRNRPQSIPLEKFKILLQYWGHEKIKSTAAKNSNNRRKVIDTHTAGRKSFAQIGNEMVWSWILIIMFSNYFVYQSYLLIFCSFYDRKRTSRPLIHLQRRIYILKCAKVMIRRLGIIFS